MILTLSGTAFCGEIQDAAAGGNLFKVSLLLKGNPVLVSSKDGNGHTPLYLAAFQGHKNVVELLLAHRAEINVKDNNGSTPLHAAAYQGYRGLAELLLTKGANVNATDNSGSTPLHYAALRGKRDIVELLLANSADVNAKDNQGRTPSELPAPDGKYVIGELLMVQGILKTHPPAPLLASRNHDVERNLAAAFQLVRPDYPTDGTDGNFIGKFYDLRFTIYEAAALMHLGDVALSVDQSFISAPYQVTLLSTRQNYPTRVSSQSISALVEFPDGLRLADKWVGEPLGERLSEIPPENKFRAQVDTSGLQSRFLSATNCKGDNLRILNEKLSSWQSGDQTTLAKVATEAKDGFLRAAAIERLTDQVALAKVALMDGWEVNRSVAIRSEVYQCVIAKVATEDRSQINRRIAIKELTDQAVLAKIAVGDKDAHVREAAVLNLTDRTTLAGILRGKDKGLHYLAAGKLAVYAIREGDLETLKAILKMYHKGILPADTCSLLTWAAFEDRREAAQLLLAAGAKVNEPERCIELDMSKEQTALQIAAATGHDDVVELLRQNGGR
jgi:ankyrin repeat protein